MKSEVLMTTTYTMFKLIKGNREIDERHVNRLVVSMSQRYIPVPIIVNKKHEIIDGQHRLAACKRLSLPIYYTVGDNYDLRDVQKINSTSKNWTTKDMAQSYATMGNEDYKTFIEFQEEWGFDKSTCVSMLYGGTNVDSGKANADFKNGLFKVKNLKYASECAEKVYQVKAFYDGFKRRSFIIALLHLFANKQYSHKQFMEKLKFNQKKLVDCANYMQYLSLIEDIYNWKSQDKVRFF